MFGICIRIVTTEINVGISELVDKLESGNSRSVGVIAAVQMLFFK